jgi:hypothetical protein
MTRTGNWKAKTSTNWSTMIIFSSSLHYMAVETGFLNRSAMAWAASNRPTSNMSKQLKSTISSCHLGVHQTFPPWLDQSTSHHIVHSQGKVLGIIWSLVTGGSWLWRSWTTSRRCETAAWAERTCQPITKPRDWCGKSTWWSWCFYPFGRGRNDLGW